MTTKEIAHIVEAILFVTGEPVLMSDIAKALEVTSGEVAMAVDLLKMDCEDGMRGIVVKRSGDHVQLATRASYAPYVERLLQPVQKQTLSQAAMETLAVIAYKQPVTRGDIEAIRGVKCDYSVMSLMNKGMIQEVGRRETLGRPILYGTTDTFLSHFGLENLGQLPAMPEKAEPEGEPLVP